MKIGSFLTIIVSAFVMTFAVIMTAIGWSRILFYTGWFAKSFAYPVAILFYIALLGFAIHRLGTFTRAAKAAIIAGLISVLLWIGITAWDQFNNGLIVAYLSNFFGMHSVIVEEQELNIMAVLCGVIWPALFTTTLFFVAGVMGPMKLSYRKF